MELSYNERLFPERPDVTSKEIKKLTEKLLQFDATPFYGDLSSCHLKGDCSMLGYLLIIAMAGYSDSYDESLAVNINNLYSLVTQDNEYLARKVVDVARTRQVEFAQSFWNLPESSLFQGIRSLHNREKL